MAKQTAGLSKKSGTGDYFVRLLRDIGREKWLYIMLIPSIAYYIVFKYAPMYGITIAFKDYLPFLGFSNSPWVGIKHFVRFFSEPTFAILFKNTIILAIYNIVFFFPLPIIFALLLNEVKNKRYKKLIQTIVYLPHFLSWVVVVGITYTMLNPESGILVYFFSKIGIDLSTMLFSTGWFRPLINLQVIWKEVGWGTIIFLAALAGVDVQLYEAAIVDGASRWQQLLHITLPALKTTVITLLILRMGSFLDTGFEHLFLMTNALNRPVGEVFDTYVYTAGLSNGQFSYSTAIGVFKSVIGMILVLTTNQIAKKLGEDGLY